MSFESIETMFNIPIGLLSALCMVESSHRNVMVPHDGGSPSYGICQMKEPTARLLQKDITAKDLMNIPTNIKMAAMYLRKQYVRYGNWCHALAAYNAGRLNLHASGLPRNVKYVRKVERHYGKSVRCL